MKKILKKLSILFVKNKEGGDTLSDFFKGGDTKEKRRVMEEAIEKANRDQRDLVERYHKKFLGV